MWILSGFHFKLVSFLDELFVICNSSSRRRRELVNWKKVDSPIFRENLMVFMLQMTQNVSLAFVRFLTRVALSRLVLTNKK